MDEILTMEQVVKKFPNRLVLAAVVGREPDTKKANKFVVLSSSVHRKNIEDLKAKLIAEGLDVVVIPTFEGEEVVRLNILTDENENLMEPQHVAEFFRTLYNIG